MLKHEFNEFQSEQILEAVSMFLQSENRAYGYARHLSDLLSSKIMNSIDQEEEVITPQYLRTLVLNNKAITDLLFDIQDAVNLDRFGKIAGAGSDSLIFCHDVEEAA